MRKLEVSNEELARNLKARELEAGALHRDLDAAALEREDLQKEIAKLKEKSYELRELEAQISSERRRNSDNEEKVTKKLKYLLIYI